MIGAGGHARVVMSLLRTAGFSILHCYDDDATKQGSTLDGLPVVGPVSSFSQGAVWKCVLAIGDNQTRRNLAKDIPWAEWATAAHTHAYVHESVRLGSGTVICAGAIVQPNAQIGSHCIINTGATVDHDCVIGDFCHVGPGCNLGGGVTLGEGSLMGIGSVAIQNTTVGAWTIVGAGAAVVADLPDHVLAVGVPARVRRKLES